MHAPKPLSVHQTLAQLAGDHPALIPKLFELELDFCCGGKRSLAEACADHGLDPERLLGEFTVLLRDRKIQEKAGLPTWTPDQGGRLIDYILDRFHKGHRAVFPGLKKMMAKVSRVHGDRLPFLADLETAVEQLISELEPHMQKEELVLFPMMRFLFGEAKHAPLTCSGTIPGRTIPGRTIPGRTDPGPPIRVMRMEHEAAGMILERIRELTHGHQLPEGACLTFANLYASLQELDREIRLHIHLENNLLFPMIEARVAQA